MLFDAILCCSLPAALFHQVKAQSDDSQKSSDETIIIIIAVTASIVIVAIIVVIVVACVCFKKKVKVIRMKAMKRIINSTTKHMVRVGKLKTMNEYFKEVDNEDVKLFPQITAIPEEEEEETENKVEEINEPIATGDIYGDNDAHNTNDQDSTNVVSVANEISSDIIEEVDEKPNAAHSNETDEQETEKVDDKPNENEKPTKSSDVKHFLQKKPPSFLNYIIKKNWKKPLVPNIPRSFPANNKVVKRKRRAVNLNKTIMIQKKKPRKKLKKLRTSNYRYNYFMKPMKTKVKSVKWNKRKPEKKPINEEGTTDQNASNNLVLTIHEEDSLA